MMIVLSAVPASIAFSVVRDRETGVRRAMDLCGLSPAAYWLSTYIVDATLTLVTLFVCLGLYAVFGVAAFTSPTSQRLDATVVLMLLYAAAMPPQTYVLSRVFRSASSAQTTIFLLNVVCVGLMISELNMINIGRNACGSRNPRRFPIAVSMIMGQAAPEAGCKVDGVLRYLYRLLVRPIDEAVVFRVAFRGGLVIWVVLLSLNRPLCVA